MVELRHAAVAIDHGLQHAHRRVNAKTMALRDVVDDLLARRGELSHGDESLEKNQGRF
jgi:hypothetical protein